MTAKKDNDGIIFTSIKHPEPNGLDEIFYCSEDVLEEREIEIKNQNSE